MTRDKGEFYPMDFRAWDTGTVDLTLEQEAAYLRLCHAMYNVKGPIPDSIRMLMGLFRCGNVKAAALRDQLIAAGKIERTADGKLSNKRVSEELADRAERSAARRRKPDSAPSESRVTPECTPSDPRVTASNPLKTKGAADTRQDRTGKNKEEPPLREGSRAHAREAEPAPVRTPVLSPVDPAWEPDSDDMVAAQAEGVPLSEILGEAAAFRDWHLSNRTLSGDWHAAWRGWCRAYRRLTRGRGPVQRGGLRLVSERQEKGRNAWAAAFEKSAAEREAFYAPQTSKVMVR